MPSRLVGKSMLSGHRRCMVVIAVVLLLVFPSSSNALFLKASNGSGALATGLAYHPATQEYMIAGIGYDFPIWGVSSSSSLLQQPPQQQHQDSYCAMIIDDTNQNREATATENSVTLMQNSYLLQRPQVCLGGVIAVPGAGVRAAHVMGTTMTTKSLSKIPNEDDNDGATDEPIDTVLQPILYDRSQPTTVQDTTNPVLLPPYTYPVSSTTGYGTSVFVALHEVHSGQSAFADKLLYHAPTSSSDTKHDKLEELLAFRRRLLDPKHIRTRPARTDQSSPRTPQIAHIGNPLLERPPGQLSLEGDYRIPLETDKDTGAATVAAMAFSKDRNWLIVGGSVHGTGAVFGSTTLGKEQDEEIHGDVDNSWDGYVSFFHGDTGELVDTDIRIHPFRVRFSDTQDDFVHDLCLDDADGVLYVVGTFHGDPTKDKNGGAFVQKYDLKTHTLVWKQQIVGADHLQSLRCAVSPPATNAQGNATKTVYIGGETQENLDDGTHLATKDVVVRAYVAASGNLVWSKQLDTSSIYNENRHDEMVQLEINPDDSTIVVALVNSMNYASGTTDVVFFDLTSDLGSNLLDERENMSPSNKEEDSLCGTTMTSVKTDPEVWATVLVAGLLPVTVLVFLLCFRQRSDSSCHGKLDDSSSTISTLNDVDVEEAREDAFFDEFHSPPLNSFKFFEGQSSESDTVVEPQEEPHEELWGAIMSSDDERDQMVDVRLI